MGFWHRWLEPREWVGVDAGVSAVKLAVAASGAGGHTVRETHLEPVRGDPLLAGHPPARRREGWPEAAAVILERDDALFRALCLTGVRPREVPRALYLELERILGRAPDNLALDYLEACADGQGGKSCYVILGAPDAAVRDVADSLRDSGWRRLAVEPHAGVLWRLWRLAAEPQTGTGGGERRRDAGGVELVLDLGASKTRLLVVAEGLPSLYRTVAVGGNSFTAALAGGTGGNRVKAEVDKVTFYQDGPMDVFVEPLRTLLGELGRTLRHYERQHGGCTRVWACGGGALWPALLATLADNLEVKVNPLILDAGDGSQVNPRFVLAAAAAVRRLPAPRARPPAETPAVAATARATAAPAASEREKEDAHASRGGR